MEENKENPELTKLNFSNTHIQTQIHTYINIFMHTHHIYICPYSYDTSMYIVRN